MKTLLKQWGGEVGMITRKMDMQYNQSRIITAILKVVATAEFYDPDATEETIGYYIEQVLEDVGFDVSVELLKKQEAIEPIPPTDESDLWKCGNCNHQLFKCTHQKYCENCGKKVKWE